MSDLEPRKLSPVLVILLLCGGLLVVYGIGAVLLALLAPKSGALHKPAMPSSVVSVGSPIPWRALAGYKPAPLDLTNPRLLAGRFFSPTEDSLALLGGDGGVRILRLDGTEAASWQSHADAQSLYSAWDWDGDGLDELLLMEPQPNDAEHLVVYEADGTKLAEEGGLYLSFRIAPADLDGDGRSEMIFASGDSFLARNSAGETVWRLADVDINALIKAKRFRLPVNGRTTVLGGADSNGDGKFEVLIQGGHNGSFLLVGLDGMVLDFDPPALVPYHCADLDGDGVSELIDPERGVYDLAAQSLHHWHLRSWSNEELLAGLQSSAGDFGPQLGRCALVLSASGMRSELRAFDAAGQLLYEERFEARIHGLTRIEGPDGPGLALLTDDGLLLYP